MHTFALPASLSGQIELSYRSQPIPCSGLQSATLCFCVCVWAVICFCQIHGLRAAWLDRSSVIRPCLYLWAEALWAPRAVRVSHCAAVKSSLRSRPQSLSLGEVDRMPDLTDLYANLQVEPKSHGLVLTHSSS